MIHRLNLHKKRVIVVPK